MNKKKQRNSQNLLYMISGIFLGISAVVFIVIGVYVQRQDLNETYVLAQETATLLETECEKYDNYDQGITARALQDLLDDAKGLRDFVDPENAMDADFLNTFIHTEHVGGIIITDASLNLQQQANMDDKDLFALWQKVLAQDCIKNVLDHPDKSYVGFTTLDETPYDYAVIASADGENLILCYASVEKPTTDPYEITLQSILENNNFHKNPTVAITNGEKLLSTNNADLKDLDSETYEKLNKSIAWKEDALTRFQYEGKAWYGIRRVYGDYCVYAVYPSESVFGNRTNYIAYGFMIYLLICLALLSVQRHFDKANLKKMKKQLEIIDAISTSYLSTLLLHLDTGSLEMINPSDFLRENINKEKHLDKLLAYLGGEYVAPKDQQQLLDFLDLATMRERLAKKSFMGTEIQDIHGTWYSVLLIPQSYDAEGNIQTLLITTRDVSAIKEAEELSYKDKLTGLYNRNYMEAHCEEWMQDEDCPITLVMADCNYLKQTNDTLGHEYGDLLLKRVAESIQKTMPKQSLAMRVGGDEFLLICRKCDHRQIETWIAQTRQELKEKSDETLKLSVSFGSYTVDHSSMSFQEAYHLADQAMYEEKMAAHANRI